jgi:hypothetical protein
MVIEIEKYWYDSYISRFEITGGLFEIQDLRKSQFKN